jgi:hypothetical protein
MRYSIWGVKNVFIYQIIEAICKLPETISSHIAHHSRGSSLRCSSSMTKTSSVTWNDRKRGRLPYWDSVSVRVQDSSVATSNQTLRRRGVLIQAKLSKGKEATSGPCGPFASANTRTSISADNWADMRRLSCGIPIHRSSALRDMRSHRRFEHVTRWECQQHLIPNRGRKVGPSRHLRLHLQ